MEENHNTEVGLTPRQEEYLAWLLVVPAERQPASKVEFAKHIGVTPPTLYTWEKKQVFRDKWKDSVDVLQMSPERTSDLLNALYRSGIQGDTKAAQLYLTATNRMAPPTLTIQPGQRAAELSDDELDAIISAMADREKAVRTQRVLKVVV